MNASNSRPSTAARLIRSGLHSSFGLRKCPDDLIRTRVVDGPGQADHQRCPAGLARLASRYRAPRGQAPRVLRGRPGGVIVEVCADRIGVQRAQADSCSTGGSPRLHSAGRRASLYSWARQVTTIRSPGPQRVADPADCPTSEPPRDLIEPIQDRQDQPRFRATPAARVDPPLRPGAGAARTGWSLTSWAPRHPPSSCSEGFHDAIEARIGTGPPASRRSSRASTNRTISIGLPDPRLAEHH